MKKFLLKEDDTQYTTENGIHTPTSSFISSLTSSENDADIEEMMGENKVIYQIFLFCCIVVVQIL